MAALANKYSAQVLHIMWDIFSLDQTLMDTNKQG